MPSMIDKTDIFEDICKELQTYKPGERFLSVRKLMQRYSVSQRVVESVLDQLVARNLISVVPGEGMFVNDQTAKEVKRLLYLCPEWPTVFFSEIEQSLSQAASIKGDFSVTRKNFPYNKNFFDLVDLRCFDAVIIFPAASDLTLSHLTELSSLNIPVVVMDKELNDIAISSIVGRNDLSGMLAASYLIRNGHDKLAVLISEPHCQSICLRSSNYCKFAELSGKEVKVIDAHSVSGEKTEDKAYESMHAYLEKNGLDFTGLFVVSDMSVLGAMKAILEHGFSIPEDVSIIGHDGLNQGKFFHPALTSIKIDNLQIGIKVMDGLRQIFKNGGKGYFHYDVEPELLIRDSVKNLNK